MTNHEILRVRRDIVRRTLRVESKQYITPRMLRIVFCSDQLRDFASSSPDDYIKIFLPSGGDGNPVIRYFTPHTWDREAGKLTLDFALHPIGPAVEWARRADAGDTLEIEASLGSTIMPDDFDWYLLVGDATALPAIGRRLESLRRGVPVQVFVVVVDVHEEQNFLSSAACQIEWLHSSGDLQQDTLAVRTKLMAFHPPAGEGFIWIAAEASVARGIYRYAVETLQHPKQWIKASAYWSLGLADARERIA